MALLLVDHKWPEKGEGADCTCENECSERGAFKCKDSRSLHAEPSIAWTTSATVNQGLGDMTFAT